MNNTLFEPRLSVQWSPRGPKAVRLSWENHLGRLAVKLWIKIYVLSCQLFKAFSETGTVLRVTQIDVISSMLTR